MIRKLLLLIKNPNSDNNENVLKYLINLIGYLNFKMVKFINFSIIIIVMISSVNSLICYESFNNGTIIANDDIENKFCIIIVSPFQKIITKRFPVKENEDNIQLYDHILSQNIKTYQIVDICIYERYDLLDNVEYLFRCICNKDKCNKGHSLHTFLKNNRFN